MHLSTSSSDARRIIRMVSACCAVLFCYHALTRAGAVRPSDGALPNEENVIRAQRYVHSDHSGQTVIVGSSMAANIKAEDIGANISSIAMAGGSAQTGLEIILRTAS